jgi:uncharacterized repeat protein (TIGR01451 family)
LSFVITGGNTAGAFAIDDNGHITVATAGVLSENAPFSLTIGVDDEDAGTTPNDTAAVTITEQEPTTIDLAIAKTDRADVVRPGSTASYSIAVFNRGPADAAGARVVDELPAALLNGRWSCVSIGRSWCPDDGIGDIDALVDIGAGDAVLFTLTARFDPGVISETVTNTVSIEAPEVLTELDPIDNVATDDTLTDLVFSGDFEPAPARR